MKDIVIYYDCGAYDETCGASSHWVSKEKWYSILLKTPMDNVYSQLVNAIRKRSMIDKSTTVLKISYCRVLADGKIRVDIENDDDVTCYLVLLENGCIYVLHVEFEEICNIQENDVGARNENFENLASKEVVDAIIVGEPEPANEIELRNEELTSKDVFGSIIIEEPMQFLASQDELVVDNVEHENHDTYYGEDDNQERSLIETGEVERIVRVDHFQPWEDEIDVILGQEFESKREVQDLVDKGSCHNCFHYVVIKSTPDLYVVKCRQASDGCKWGMRVARTKKSNKLSLRTYTKMHSCSRAIGSTSKIKRKGSSRAVASVVRDEFPGQLDTPTAKSLMGMVQVKLGMKVCYTTAWRGRKLAIRDVRGTLEESYKMLHSYLYMLEMMNPGTITRVKVDEDCKFEYMFFALGACVEGFKVMRKVIVVDGTFLKTRYKGVLIVATAQDPNHHHYPIAFGVVDGENDKSWTWFMEMLKIVVPDNSELVFISDRHNSIIKSIEKVYPLAYHGYCMYHISQNVKSKVRYTNKEIVAEKFRECARVYTEVEFERLYGQFRGNYPLAAVYLDERVDVRKWARCYFPKERYNIDTSNSVESINGIFAEARKYSLLSLIDAIIGKIGEWFNKHRNQSCEVPTEKSLVPYVEIEIHKRCAEANKLTVFELNRRDRVYNVIGLDGKNYLVNLDMKTCLCKCFDIDRYPCVHAIAALSFAVNTGTLSIGVHDLCSKYYTMQLWMLAYSRTIFPVPHFSEWVIPESIQALSIVPPNYVNPNKGRDRQKRFTSVGEHGRKKKKTTII